MNPTTPFVNGQDTLNGVFDTDSTQTLYFFVDLKTDGAKTWKAVLDALEPLRKAGYLTTYDGKSLTSAPVTIIGTGNTPAQAVKSADPRYAFYDAPGRAVEGHLVALTDMQVPVPGLDLTLTLGRDETINVGFSAKFDHDDFIDDLAGHGLRHEAEWIDPVTQYGIFLFRR